VAAIDSVDIAAMARAQAARPRPSHYDELTNALDATLPTSEADEPAPARDPSGQDATFEP